MGMRLLWVEPAESDTAAIAAHLRERDIAVDTCSTEDCGLALLDEAEYTMVLLGIRAVSDFGVRFYTEYMSQSNRPTLVIGGIPSEKRLWCSKLPDGGKHVEVDINKPYNVDEITSFVLRINSYNAAHLAR